MKRILIDTNVYIDFMNTGRAADAVLGGELIRYMSTVVLMELAGMVLRKLKESGREIRRSSLVHDVLIALTARDIGATVFTSDASDYAAVRKHLDFSYEVIGAA